MAEVLTSEQGVIQTSIGDYNIPIANMDGNIEQSWHYYGDIFSNLEWSFFFDGSTQQGTNFTLGPDVSGQWENGHYIFRFGNDSYDMTGWTGKCCISVLCRWTDTYGLWSVTRFANEAAPIDINSFLMLYATIIEPVTTTSFGKMKLASQGQSGYYQTNNIEIATVSQWGEYIAGQFPPEYVWRSWERLAGNGGQFNINLPVIKTTIADQITPSDNQFLESDDFLSIPIQASIWNTYLNALLGEEYTIAWSGNNRLTLTVTNHSSDSRYKVFTFKWYLGATDAPFAVLVDNVMIGSTNPTDREYIASNYLISIMYDQTQEVAAPVMLPYYPNNTSYDYLSDAYTPWSNVTMHNLYTWLQGSAGAPSGTGPYDTGTSDTGGTPTGGGHQDPMPSVHVPALSGAASGMFTIYCPDDTELGQIARFLWSDDVLDNFKKYFNNFSDNIIALYVLPYKAANLPTKAFTVGNLQSQTITAVEYITTRFVSVDMGELTVGTRWDSYLDFEPYTKFNIYLPGIGVQALSADDIICPANDDESLPEAKGSKISLVYVLDLMTGNIAAYVKINGQIRYQFTGKVGYSIPITGANYNSMVQGYVMATAGLIGTLASGGTAAPFAASAGAAGIINAMKPDVYRGGNASGDSSALCLDYPYLIRRRPNKPYLNEQEIYTGFPSYKSGLLSEFSGFTQVLDAHIEGISCTEAERAEILQLLKSGVIL